ncbi:Glucan endo-1,3-beta-glucosidase [Vigna angularis]|uniref:glucan endo-1,3-beta-D-glucosidase n=1 Tax=Phaseolus angularis TaxID=3914 RepID=A0A8T0KJ84_PHAAN|nr:Glucan endo-1,3-beta-glucosidase [Vigna angularis]
MEKRSKSWKMRRNRSGVGGGNLEREKESWEPYNLYSLNPEIPLGIALFQEYPFNFCNDFTTGVHYRNLFDVMVDVVIALAIAGYETIPLVVTETGWPSFSVVENEFDIAEGRIGKKEKMDVERSSLCNCVVNFLLKENYVLTAFELLHELLDDGRDDQAIRLKQYFSDPSLFPPDLISRLSSLREILTNPMKKKILMKKGRLSSCGEWQMLAGGNEACWEMMKPNGRRCESPKTQNTKVLRGMKPGPKPYVLGSENLLVKSLEPANIPLNTSNPSQLNSTFAVCPPSF